MHHYHVENVDAEIAQLRQQTEILRLRLKASVVSAIVSLMKQHGVTPEDLSAHFPRIQHKFLKSALPQKVPPRYRHPITGETWTGRGKPAKWIAEAEAVGMERRQFLLEEAGQEGSKLGTAISPR